MKKLFCLCISLVMIAFALSSCTSKANTPKGAEEIPVNQDLRIQVNSYGLDKFTHEQIKNAQSSMMQPSFLYDASTVESLNESCPWVVRCVIKEISYTTNGGLPFIIDSIQILESLKGDLEKGDLISVMQLGGYISMYEHHQDGMEDIVEHIPKEEQEKIIYNFKINPGLEDPKENEEYIIFLQEMDVKGGPFEGACVAVNDYQGRFKFLKGNTFMRGDGKLSGEHYIAEIDLPKLKDELKELNKG